MEWQSALLNRQKGFEIGPSKIIAIFDVWGELPKQAESNGFHS